MKDKTNMFAAGQAKASARQTALKETTTAKETAEPTPATAPESTEKPKAAPAPKKATKTAPVKEEATQNATQQDITTVTDQGNIWQGFRMRQTDISGYKIPTRPRTQPKDKKLNLLLYSEIYEGIAKISEETGETINDLFAAAAVKIIQDYEKK